MPKDPLKTPFEYHTAEQVYARGIKLKGMTFRDVLDLGITPEGVSREYGNRKYKGGMGVLVEERFFGYKANSEREPDFAEAGVELKATCFDIVKRSHGTDKSAGERLSLTMIPYDEELSPNLYDSHLFYSEGSMAFPDLLENPSRTILTGEGGAGASRFKHIICRDGRWRRLVPDELDRLQGFPAGWTAGMTDGHRAFCMGNALVVGVVHRIGKAIAAQR